MPGFKETGSVRLIYMNVTYFGGGCGELKTNVGMFAKGDSGPRALEDGRVLD